MNLRERMMKAASLFIEVTPDERPEMTANSDVPLTPAPQTPADRKTVEHLVRESSGADLADITLPSSVPLVPQDDNFDFITLYQQAELPATPFSAEQLLDMLTTLPNELTLEVKRQTVKATLNAIGKSVGATPESIVTDASRKFAVLTRYIEQMAQETEKMIAEEKAQIEALQATITQKRQTIEQTTQRKAEIEKRCHLEADRLDDVLEFFSLDVPPSKYAAPRP